MIDKEWLSSEGHRSDLDCARWACVAVGPMLLTAGRPHATMSDFDRDFLLMQAGWTEADVREALKAFVEQ
jgi:hypothetical protein